MAPAHPSDLLHSFPLLTQGGTTSPLRGHFSNPVPSSWEPGTGATTRQPHSNILWELEVPQPSYSFGIQ